MSELPGDRMKPERFMAAWPVSDSMADDAEAMAALEEYVRREGWAEAVEAVGGYAIEMGPELLDRVGNVGYGWPLTDDDGEPLLDDDGQPMVDHLKFTLIARGWAVRNGGGHE